MPRAGQLKPVSDSRLPDHVAIGVLTRVFPPELVDGVLVEAGRVEQRHRLLPARLMVYYVLALALFADGSYEEVMRQLVEGLAWESRWSAQWTVPSKMAISKAREGGEGAVGVVVPRGRGAARYRFDAWGVLPRVAVGQC